MNHQTTAPAAAGRTPSRRSVLAAGAALGAVAAPAAALAATGAGSPPRPAGAISGPEMADLYRSYLKASARLEAAYRARQEAEGRLTYPEMPQALRMTQDFMYRDQAKIGRYHHMLVQLQG